MLKRYARRFLMISVLAALLLGSAGSSTALGQLRATEQSALIKAPTFLPDFAYGMAVANPDNTDPLLAGFGWRMVFDRPANSNVNSLLRIPVTAADLNDLNGFQFRVYLQVSYASSVTAFEIGNEPNLSSEWGTAPDAAVYRQLLCAAYGTIHATRPWANVISGGLAPTGRVPGIWNGHSGHDGLKQDEREFLKEFLAAGGGSCLDALGYNALGFRARYDAAPDVNGGTPDTDCTSGLCFRSIEKAHGIMESYGVSKPVWATEVGWLTAPPAYCQTDPRWAGRTWQIVTPAQQADNLVGAFRYARLNWPWLNGMFIFNLDFSSAGWYDECEQMRFYSVQGQPAWDALTQMPKQYYRLFQPLIRK